MRPVTDSMDAALSTFWQGGMRWLPSPVRSMMPRPHEVADAALSHASFCLEAASTIPSCADPRDRFLPLIRSLERMRDALEQPRVMTLVNPIGYTKLLMSVIDVFTERRSEISVLPRGCLCSKFDIIDEDHHNPPGPRCLIEGQVIDTAWKLFSMCMREFVGIDIILEACKSDLLLNLTLSGSTPRPKSINFPERETIHLSLLKSTLPLYALYPRVYRALGRDLICSDFDRLQPFPKSDRELAKAWSEFNQSFMRLETIKERARGKAEFFERCMSAQCELPGSAELRQCSGCHVVRYCSSQCQSADWGTHRSHCYLFQCSKSHWKEFGHNGFLFLAEFEASSGGWNHVLPLLYKERAKHEYASPNYPVFTMDHSLHQERGWKPFSSFGRMWEQRCWKRSLPVLKEIGHLSVLQLPWGKEKLTILSPLTALSVLDAPDFWAVPSYTRLA
ncbi:hypothetical protein HGRIS_013235 [Hohenbuehelia grisea]|uniref:MYND-type domain-containing protein n=1 Tax=Hohenbuehelia grisea TaxID=104357 RepID=A0ABR3IV18_9AGAR